MYILENLIVIVLKYKTFLNTFNYYLIFIKLIIKINLFYLYHYLNSFK